MRTPKETLLQSADFIEQEAQLLMESSAIPGTQVLDDPQDAYQYEDQMKLAGELRQMAEESK